MANKHVRRHNASALQLRTQLRHDDRRVTSTACGVAARITGPRVSDCPCAMGGDEWLHVTPDIQRVAEARCEYDRARPVAFDSHLEMCDVLGRRGHRRCDT